VPQAYENLNGEQLKPKQCVKDWARPAIRRSVRTQSRSRRNAATQHA
jgi:hypothetical protein